MDIYHLCILFLFEAEYFDIIGNKINLSQDRMTITKDQSGRYDWLNTSYGKNIILSTSKKIIRWTLKMKPFQLEKIKLLELYQPQIVKTGIIRIMIKVIITE